MARRGRPRHPDILTPREWEVLNLLRRNLTNEQIAERLGITLDGAKYHVSEILSKLNVSSREEAAAWRPEDEGREKISVPHLRRWALAPLALKTVGMAAAVAALGGLGVLAWGVATTEGETIPRDAALLNAFHDAWAGHEVVFDLEVQLSDYASGLDALDNQIGFTQSDRERTERALAKRGITVDDPVWIVHWSDTGHVAYNRQDTDTICADRLFVVDATTGFPRFPHAFEFPCPADTESVLDGHNRALQIVSTRYVAQYCGEVDFGDPPPRSHNECIPNFARSSVEIEPGTYRTLIERLEALGYPALPDPIRMRGRQGEHAWLIRFGGPSGYDLPACLQTAMIVETSNGEVVNNQTIPSDSCDRPITFP